MKKAKPWMTVVALTLLMVAQCSTVASANDERPMIVCTTNVLGSLVQGFLGGGADVVVLVRPGLCPADFDMKPSDVYAVSKASLLFYHAIPGEFWLQGLIEASGNTNLTKVVVPGVYNTPEGARRCITLVGGNLSRVLSIDLNSTVSAMLADVDAAESEIGSEAEELGVTEVKVVCMKWQRAFVESVGFDVVADYDPPESLSAGYIVNLTDTAKKEGVALVIDNLQVGVDFGAGLASEIGGEHVVLTNFPGAIPGTGNITQMFRYNARQLFEGLRTWRSTGALRAEIEGLKGQLTIFQAATAVAVIVVALEAVWLYTGRKRR